MRSRIAPCLDERPDSSVNGLFSFAVDPVTLKVVFEPSMK
jgi:hypothetical protein